MIQAFLPLRWRVPLGCVLAAALAGCVMPPEAQQASEPGVFTPTRDGPEGAAPGTCWGRTVSPAVVENVTERVLVTPAEVSETGTIRKPPVYRTEDRQIIVRPRQNNWFETPCPDVLTEDFVASLQRALTARGLYAGEITGVLDGPTRAAVQSVQKAEGLDSPVLAVKTAQALGLIVIDRPETG